MKKWIALTLNFCLAISIIAQPSFTENTIDGSYDGSFSVYAIDVDGSYALGANIYFNLSTITGSSATAGTVSNYVLLFRAGTSGDFLQFNTANSVNGDIVEFTGVSLSPGYYTLGTKDAASSPLPVEWLSFTGKKVENNVLLQWQTVTEINNSHFDVEWSIDGISFEKIGEVAGAGTTNEAQNYEFLDQPNLRGLENFLGLNYYRLRQVDLPAGQAGFDGKYEYSKTINITIRQYSNPSIKIFPNPATDFLMIENANGQATIYNTTGQFVQQFLITNSQFTVNVSRLREGQYILKIQQENGTIETIKFLK